jgi:hypothetical protein
MDVRPMNQITALKSSDDLRSYLEERSRLNISLMLDNSKSTLLHYASFNNDATKIKIYIQHYKAYCELNHGKGLYMNEAGF